MKALLLFFLLLTVYSAAAAPTNSTNESGKTIIGRYEIALSCVLGGKWCASVTIGELNYFKLRTFATLRLVCTERTKIEKLIEVNMSLNDDQYHHYLDPYVSVVHSCTNQSSIKGINSQFKPVAIEKTEVSEKKLLDLDNTGKFFSTKTINYWLKNIIQVSEEEKEDLKKWTNGTEIDFNKYSIWN